MSMEAAVRIRLKDIVNEVPQDLLLSYDAFWQWLTRVGGRLISLRKTHDNATLVGELTEQLRLGFQAFYLAFVARGTETVTLEMSWSSWRELVTDMGSKFDAPGGIGQTQDATSARIIVECLGKLNALFSASEEYVAMDLSHKDRNAANDMAAVRPVFDTPCIGWRSE